MTYDGESNPNDDYAKLIGFLDQDQVENLGKFAKYFKGRDK